MSSARTSECAHQGCSLSVSLSLPPTHDRDPPHRWAVAVNMAQYNDGLIQDMQLEPYRQQRGWLLYGFWTVSYKNGPFFLLISLILATRITEPD